MRHRLALAACLTACLGPCAAGAARADWLRQLPQCALEGTSEPVMRMHYPRPGLPAAVRGGEPLVARIQLPAPLTPPPGRQQARALRPWRAGLAGHATHLLGAQPADVPLAVTDVRPDGGLSLVYRVRLEVPAGTAPGTYSLWLDAPGASLRTAAAVAVLEANHTARIGFWPAVAPSARAAQAMAALPVDVWIARGDSTPPSRPWLAPDRAVALLAHGKALWQVGRCGTPPAHAAATEQAVATQAGLVLTPLPGLPPSPPTAADTDDDRLPRAADGTALSTVEPAPPEQVHTGDGVRLRAGGAAADIDLVLPAGPSGFVVKGAAAAWFPGATPATVAARVRLTPGQAVTLQRAGHVSGHRADAPDTSHLALPQGALSGDAPTLRVAGGPDDLRVAWTLDDHATAYGPRHLAHRFDAAGTHSVRAQVIHGNGAVTVHNGTLEVGAARRSGCGVLGADGLAGDPTGGQHRAHGTCASGTLWGALVVLWAARRSRTSRRRRRRGPPGAGVQPAGTRLPPIFPKARCRE